MWTNRCSRYETSKLLCTCSWNKLPLLWMFEHNITSSVSLDTRILWHYYEAIYPSTLHLTTWFSKDYHEKILTRLWISLIALCNSCERVSGELAPRIISRRRFAPLFGVTCLTFLWKRIITWWITVNLLWPKMFSLL